MELSVFIVLSLMILITTHQLGFKSGRLDAKYQINKRMDKVLAKLSVEEKQNFNMALIEVINEEKK
jgi:hypothetical protein